MENKTSKYFKYAIGEIVLVVIGILIALQINNWNQNRLEKIKSKEFHQRIIQDLDLMIVNMNGMIDKSTRVKTHIISSLNILRNNVFNKEQKDTLDYALKNYYQFLRLDESIKSIEEMKSSGQFGLIHVKELKKAIDDYLIILSNISKIFDQIAIDVNNDAIIEKHLFIEVKGTNLDSNVFYDFNAIKKDQAFINRLSKISMSWQTKLVFSKLLLKRSKELKEKIELELNK